MISIYFGLPGSGKTTLITYLALKAVKQRKYKRVCTNVIGLKIPNVEFFDCKDIGHYDTTGCLLLIDEIQLFADNRDWSTFDNDHKKFLFLHRHFKCDIAYFSQQWDGADSKIRGLSERVYYVRKNPVLRGITTVYRVPNKISFPTPDSPKGGQIIMGYFAPGIFERLFALRILRSRYYKYFDSYYKPFELKPYKWKFEPLSPRKSFLSFIHRKSRRSMVSKH